MCLEKLYADLTVLTGMEFPLPRFLVAVDTVCRGWLARYPKHLLAVGEYATPVSLADTLPFDACLYPALLDAALGRLTGDAARTARGDAAAEAAYLTLWRASARGKHRKGDKW